MMDVIHHFYGEVPVPEEPMSDSAFRRLQPIDQSSAAFGEAAERVAEARQATEYLLEQLAGRRQTALLRGTGASVTAVEVEIAKARSWLDRVSALAEVLPAELARALEREAAAEEQCAALTETAAAAVAKFNAWVGKHYMPAARVIAQGLELELQAETALLALAQASGASAAHPVRATMRVAHTSAGRPSTSPTTFRRMVRLPNAEPGPAIAWPPGQPHPDYA